ncbi:hypothetical protein CNEO4_200015 [Clostridium neonatale]|nr:hypothetical protein CNEO4_200015 [Clostridium neonatale]
MLRELIVLE